MDRRIVCLHIPCFEIAIARLEDRSLMGSPTAVGPIHEPRGFLWEVSPEAHNNGIYAGMQISKARRLCPDLRLLAPDPRRLIFGRDTVLKIARRFTPVAEPASRGDFYFDLTGCARLFGQAADTALTIKKEIRRNCSITGGMGVATNKLVSGVAANLFEDSSIYEVRAGQERSFLAPVSVASLPELNRLLSPKTNETVAKLDELRLRSLGEIASVTLSQLHLVVGPKARLLRQWALGIDPSPVWTLSDQPSLEVSHIFEREEIDDDVLLALLYRLLERLCKTLRNQSRFLRCIRLTVHYSDGREVMRRHEFLQPSFFEGEIYPQLEQLFLSLHRRIRVRKISFAAEPTNQIAQLSLFREEKIERLRNLTAAVDRIRERYGDTSVSRGLAAGFH